MSSVPSANLHFCRDKTCCVPPRHCIVPSHTIPTFPPQISADPILEVRVLECPPQRPEGSVSSPTGPAAAVRGGRCHSAQGAASRLRGGVRDVVAAAGSWTPHCPANPPPHPRPPPSVGPPDTGRIPPGRNDVLQGALRTQSPAQLRLD